MPAFADKSYNIINEGIWQEKNEKNYDFLTFYNLSGKKLLFVIFPYIPFPSPAGSFDLCSPDSAYADKPDIKQEGEEGNRKQTDDNTAH